MQVISQQQARMMVSELRSTINSVKSRAFHSSCLITATALLSFMLFSGIVIDRSLNNGMKNMDRRLGADLMIVPKGAKEKAENLILEGQRGTFYFDGSVDDRIREVEGIKEVTAQCFLKSLSADCCSSEVELVFYDPETDFIVGPWIAENYSNSIGPDSVIVGSDIVCENGTIKLFGKEYKVLSSMAKTGTALDTSVYFPSDAMPAVLADAEAKSSFLTEEQKDGDILSSVFVNIEDGYDTSKVIEKCRQKVGDVDVVYLKQLNESLSDNLLKITDVLEFVLIAGTVLIFVILVLINSVIINDRKQEIALSRILGRSKKKICNALIKETGCISLFGSFIGCGLGALIVIPFGRYIGMKLDMPYLGPGAAASVIQLTVIMIIVFLISLFSSLFVVIKTTNIEPYLALKKEAE